MKQIIVAQRGWVFVGEVSTEGEQVKIENASCIRRWGTTKGLGELAQNGPRPNTVLDSMGTVRLHSLAVVASIDCEAEKWAAA